MFKKISIFVLVFLLISVVLSACGLAKEGPFVIGLSNFSLGNSWRVQMIEEAKYYANQHKDLVKELIVTEAEEDISKQISDIEDLIVKNVDAILITAASPKLWFRLWKKQWLPELL